MLVFVGPDRARKRQRLEQLAASLKLHELDRHALVAGEPAADELPRLIREHPIGGPCRLIVVDEAHRLDAALANALQAFAGDPSATNVVVLLVDGQLEAKWPISALKVVATMEAFDAPSDPQARSGPNVFGLVDALARRDAKAALALLDQQLAEGREVYEVVGLLGWQLQRWLTVSRLMRAGDRARQGEEVPRAAERAAGLRANASAIEAAGITDWQARKMAEQLGSWTTEALLALARRCLDLDHAAKSGRVVPRLALEQLIVETCGLTWRNS